MACGGGNEKDLSVALKSFLLPHQTKHQVKQKTIVNIHLLSRVKYYLQYRRLEKVKTVLMLKQLLKKSIKPVAQVLMKAALRSIYLNYQTRKLSLMLKLHNIQIIFAFPLQKLLPKIIYLHRWKKLYQTILSNASKKLTS